MITDIKEYMRLYREKNKEKISLYRENNRDKYKAYRVKNKDQIKAYRIANKVKYREAQIYYNKVKHANERARSYGIIDKITLDDIREILSVNKCFYCGVLGEPVKKREDGTRIYTKLLGIDHRVPLSKGGSNTKDNIVPCCVPCNSSKNKSNLPNKWAWNYTCCLMCKTTEKKHIGKGYCRTCYYRAKSNKGGAR